MPYNVKLKNILLYTSSSEYDKLLKVSKFPYYLGLKHNDSKIYDNYVKTLSDDHQTRDTSTLDGLRKLMDDIIKNGFQFNDESISIKHYKKNKYKCNRGRHRICILYFLYGKNCKIKIKNNTIYNII